ncbi:MAG: ribonuclease P protein component [Candidatus Auribacterota bacterium]
MSLKDAVEKAESVWRYNYISLMTRKSFCLRKRQQFTRLYDSGLKIVLENTIIFIGNNDDPSENHFGVTVTKKIGKSVVRNALKRKYREIYFSLKSGLKSGIDIVFIARKTAPEIGYWQLHDEIKKGFQATGFYAQEDSGSHGSCPD